MTLHTSIPNLSRIAAMPGSCPALGGQSCTLEPAYVDTYVEDAYREASARSASTKARALAKARAAEDKAITGALTFPDNPRHVPVNPECASTIVADLIMDMVRRQVEERMDPLPGLTKAIHDAVGPGGLINGAARLKAGANREEVRAMVYAQRAKDAWEGEQQRRAYALAFEAQLITSIEAARKRKRTTKANEKSMGLVDYKTTVGVYHDEEGPGPTQKARKSKKESAKCAEMWPSIATTNGSP